MVLDIIIAIIIIVGIAFGFYNGFARTLAQAGGWVAAVVLGFLLSPMLKTFFIENTDMEENFKMQLLEKGFVETDPIASGSAIPNIVESASLHIADYINETIASNLSTLFISIISFAAIIVLFKVVTIVIVKIFSRRGGFGFMSMSDGILGAIVGMIKALIIVFLILAIMFPIIGIVSPEFSADLMKMMENSTVAYAMYNNNWLLIFVESVF